MEYSSYNYLFQYGKKQIVYNFITGAFLVEGSEKYNKLIQFRSNGEVSEDLSDLVESRFVVDSNVSEKEFALQLRREKLLSTDFFSVTINTTYDCNFDCEYCHQSHLSSTNVTDETIDKIITIIEQKYQEVGFKKLELSLFGGEPLLNFSGVYSIVSKVKTLSARLNFKLSLFITTNGSLITDKVTELLDGVRTTFQITLDGNRERHNKTRPFRNSKPTYDLILSNVDKILNKLPMARINLRSNYDRTINVEHYYDVLQVIKKYPRNRVYVTLVKVFQEDEKSIPNDKLLSVVSLFNRFGFVTLSTSMFSTSACSMTYRNSLFVDYDGSYKICSATGVKAYNEDSNPRQLENYLRIIDNVPSQCKECIYLTRCLGPCIRSLIDNAGDEYHCMNNLPPESSMKLFIKQEMIKLANEK